MEDFKDEAPPKKKGGFGCGGFFAMLMLVVLLVGGGYFWWKFYYTYSDGYRSGLLQKLSHKGNIMKTYEGELVLSSVQSNNNVALASEKFYFSVANDSIARAMMGLEGKQVKLHYEQKNGALPWRGDTEYIVDGFEVERVPLPPSQQIIAPGPATDVYGNPVQQAP